ncbi:Sphingolipid long chain base-responsive protein LSP1 OS=Saccharomyces cerevisiae (strain ATCC 204508 / S288c) GN=LSP1 PE=1 SV=1 [Rhizoctonia solani AG-1 IB]|uniref:Sphingolipid long chain base-responsive protein LSP1 n=2 Tax=Thanatephorus cucumeris (strain AG1-IB / isolate 7/3/14) TaxID=1108050 RepID=A0A0B7FMH3_THACB|nr:Sphingolipid long chain base-responsive protein LSP1 OS=Saccharomyces cerevisiae (strain ATCC 204508 / S288c) GN=LSP1 PE=1 SV=1 [Rhizoctonia solani AG-1 IB]
MFHKLQAKAQAALASATHRNDHNNDQAEGQTDPTQPTQQSGGRHHAIDNITHTLKQLHTQYSPQVRPDARQLQLLITSQKGLALDFDAVSRESKSHSKELYLWGQDQVDDIKDVSDRIAYLNFAHGSLATDLAKSLDSSRASFKSLRDAETTLHPRRVARAGMKAEIDKIRQAGATGKAPSNGAERIAELEAQLSKAEQDDAPQEREVGLLKRRALVECERRKWSAFREYAAKLELLSDAAEALIDELPEQELTGAYAGAQNTARIRSQLQNTLDSYMPAQGRANKFKAPHVPPGVGIGADTRSFGETHKDELESLPPTTAPTPQTGPGALAEQRFGTQGSGQHLDPASATVAQPGAHGVTHTGTSATSQPTPINPTSLNHAPASIPPHSPTVSSPLRDTIGGQEGTQVPSTADSATSGSVVPIPAPQSNVTVAETGVPLTAGADGPGPKSGSLSRDNVPTTAPPAGAAQTGMVLPPNTNDELPGFAGATKHESAEEEKARLAREERERLLHTGAPSTAHPTAEEEKARLEREERDRLLRGQAQEQDDKGGDGKTVPPPYADF